jgi:hypothetical protein
MSRHSLFEVRQALINHGHKVEISDARIQLLRDVPRVLQITLAQLNGMFLIHFGDTPVTFVELNKEEAIGLARALIQACETVPKLHLTGEDPPQPS